MRNFTKLLLAGGLALLGSRAAQAQTLYDNFENTRLITYSYVSGALNAVANPGGGSVNTSTTCGKYDRDGTQYAVVVMNPTNAYMADVSAYSAGTKKISMKFRSPGPGVAVQLVLQNKTKAAVNTYPLGNYGGTFNATTAAAANVWETLTFTYTASASGSDATVTATTVDQLVMLVAPNTTTATTYYLDDIMGPELVAGSLTPATPTGPTATAVLLDNFESTRLLNYPTVQGTLNQAAANPGSSTANSSTTCASFARDGSQQYATIVIQPKSGKFGNVSAFTGGTQSITMKFRSPAAGTAVQVVLQNKTKTATGYPNGNYGGTFDATTTAGANNWETLTFKYTANASGADASVMATDVDQIALLIAPNGTSASTYYFDDLTGPSLATVTATRQASTFASLSSPFPNPATEGLARLPFALQQGATVSLTVFDALGRRVAQPIEAKAYPAGEHAADISTARLAPGIYTCRLLVDGAVLTSALSVQ